MGRAVTDPVYMTESPKEYKFVCAEYFTIYYVKGWAPPEGIHRFVKSHVSGGLVPVDHVSDALSRAMATGW